MQLFVLALTMAALLILPTRAPAADKLLSSMVSPSLSGTSAPVLVGPLSLAWTNGTSKGKTKFLGNCKVSVKLSNTALPDSDGIPGTGDEVICLLDVEPGPQGFVFRGEANGGTVKVRADLIAEGLTCSGFGVYDLRMTCYEADGAYAPPFTIPFPSDPTQGLVAGGYPPRPATGLIVTDGIFFP